MKLHSFGLLIAALAFGGELQAQQISEVPANMRPPAGMCRIWLDSVPSAQQPAPTDCATAVKNRPRNGRVIFGDDYAAPPHPDTVRRLPPGIRGFAPRKSSVRRPRTSPPPHP